MGKYVASEVIKLMVQRDIRIKGSRILVLGFTFKENCPDVRNTRAVDVVNNLKSYGTEVTVFDPWASPEEVKEEYGLTTVQDLPDGPFDAVVLAVAHKEYLQLKLRGLLKEKGILYDVKGVLKERVDARL